MPDAPEDDQQAAASRQPASTLFAHAIAVCGLSYAETAAFLGVSLPSVKSYATGKRTPPVTTMARLTQLWDDVSFRAEPIREIPESAKARREAIRELRTRAWIVGRKVPRPKRPKKAEPEQE